MVSKIKGAGDGGWSEMEKAVSNWALAFSAELESAA
jgi:hypothetical protein